MDTNRLRQLAGVPLIENPQEQPSRYYLHVFNEESGVREDLGVVGPFPSKAHADRWAAQIQEIDPTVHFEEGSVLTPEEFAQTLEDPGLI